MKRGKQPTAADCGFANTAQDVRRELGLGCCVHKFEDIEAFFQSCRVGKVVAARIRTVNEQVHTKRGRNVYVSYRPVHILTAVIPGTHTILRHECRDIPDDLIKDRLMLEGVVPREGEWTEEFIRMIMDKT